MGRLKQTARAQRYVTVVVTAASLSLSLSFLASAVAAAYVTALATGESSCCLAFLLQTLALVRCWTSVRLCVHQASNKTNVSKKQKHPRFCNTCAPRPSGSCKGYLATHVQREEFSSSNTEPCSQAFKAMPKEPTFGPQKSWLQAQRDSSVRAAGHNDSTPGLPVQGQALIRNHMRCCMALYLLERPDCCLQKRLAGARANPFWACVRENQHVQSNSRAHAALRWAPGRSPAKQNFSQSCGSLQL